MMLKGLYFQKPDRRVGQWCGVEAMTTGSLCSSLSRMLSSGSVWVSERIGLSRTQNIFEKLSRINITDRHPKHKFHLADNYSPCVQQVKHTLERIPLSPTPSLLLVP